MAEIAKAKMKAEKARAERLEAEKIKKIELENEEKEKILVAQRFKHPTEEEAKNYAKQIKVYGIEKARLAEFRRIEDVALKKHRECLFEEAIEHYDDACKFLYSAVHWGQRCTECGTVVAGIFTDHNRVCGSGHPEGDIDSARKGFFVICKSNAAQCCTNIDAFNGTISRATEALEKDPNHVLTLWRRGIGYSAMGKKEAADADFLKSRKGRLD